ncbi:MAG: hypothetical protein K0R50_57 [Eubacterium sp.]|jgi:uncharacterized membrane protein YcaP (DUF421 family)|nr:hypothetical protein [Eubacterium sp.]
MENVLVTSLRTAIGFSVLLILTRILGKKQMGQLTIFTYITGIALGNIAGDMVVHRDIKIIDGVTGLVLWAIFTLIVEFLSLKSSKVRVLLDGEPTIVIKKGEIMYEKLSSQRLNLDDLTMLLRTNNIFSVKDVEYAILEPNGQLSVLKKPDKEQVTRKDLNISVNDFLNIPTEIIVDGKLVTANLTEIGQNRQWLDQQLKQAGITSISQVLYAELQSDGSLYIKNKKVKNNT